MQYFYCNTINKKISAIIFILWQNGISSICWGDKGGKAMIAEVALQAFCRKM